MMKLFNLLLCLFFPLYCGAQATLSPAEFVVNSTIKIESIEKRIESGKVKYYRTSGTGFFFIFQMPKGEVPVIVTNRHVIEDTESGTLFFKLADKSGNFSYLNIEKVDLNNFRSRWIVHPDTSVDLAILPIASILNEYRAEGKNIMYAPYREKDIPSDSVKNTLTAIEDIIMVGYPFGLRDAVNDLPVVRKGITATPVFLNYNSAKEFLCDISVYPGSSGSPILIFNPNTHTVRAGGTYMSMRLLLLGINYATYTRDFKGKIIPKASYNIEDSLMVNTAIPYNIGIVIKSERLLEFKPIFLK